MEAEDKHEVSKSFESIGRFVQSFEHMVQASRFGILQLCACNNDPRHQGLLNVIVRHSALSARPLLEILQAIIGQLLNDEKANILKSEKEAIPSIVKQIAREYISLAEKRNAVLHGTWYVGWGLSPADAASKMIGMKFRPSKTGLARTDIPGSSAEMLDLAKRCDDVEHLLMVLVPAMTMPEGALSGQPRITKNFQKDKSGVWSTSVTKG